MIGGKLTMITLNLGDSCLLSVMISFEHTWKSDKEIFPKGQHSGMSWVWHASLAGDFVARAPNEAYQSHHRQLPPQ